MLTEQDFEILNFINKRAQVDKDSLYERFPENLNATKYRLESLLQPEYRTDILHAGQIPIENSSYIIELYKESLSRIGSTILHPTGIYELTNLGKKALVDYHLQKKLARRKYKTDLILRILPIILSLLSVILSAYAIFKVSK